LAERDLPDVGARLYHHARHLRTVATARAIGGEAPLMLVALLVNDSKRR